MNLIKVNNISISKTVDFFIIKFLGEKRLSLKKVDQNNRKKYAYLEAWVSIISNLVLAIIMFIFGLMLNSISLLANATHTASDMLSSIIILIGFKLSGLPADKKHPFGHGRIEFISTALIAIILMIVGVEFGINAYHRFTANIEVKGDYVIAVIMFVSAFFKIWMSLFSLDLGNRINSSALIADSWHHKADGIAMFLVVIAIMASKFKYYRVDALFGFVISLLIIFTGINILKDSFSKLIGEIPDENLLKEIKDVALLVPGAISVHKIKIHNYGDFKEISLHVQIKNNLSLVKAHNLSEKVERLIESKTYCKALVHVEPIDSTYNDSL
ncbi:MAG: cation diffusion facilitator family transporter [Atribacterota bacterium]